MDMYSTIPYQELAGTAATWDLVESWVHTLPVVRSLVFLSKLNESLGLERVPSENIRDSNLRDHIVRQFRERVGPPLKAGHILFYPHQVMAAMNLILLWGQSDGDSTLQPLTAAEERTLALVLVAITDLIDAKPVLCHAEEVSYLLKRWTMAHAEPVPSLLARWRHMLIHGPRPTTFDLDGLFHAVTGYDVATYFDAGLLRYLGLYADTQRQVATPMTPWMATDTYFRSSQPALAVLSSISTTLKDLQSRVKDIGRNPEDLLYVSRHIQLTPVIRFPSDQVNQYLVLNLARLGERLSSGSYYTVVNDFKERYPAEERQVKAYQTWLGQVFEDYIVKLLSSVSAWQCTPENPGTAMADATVRTPDDAMVIECKTKRIRAKALETGRVDLFRQDLAAESGSVEHAATQLSQRLHQVQSGIYLVPMLETCTTQPVACTLEATPAIGALAREVDDIFHRKDWYGSPHPLLVSAFDLETLVAGHEKDGAGLRPLREWSLTMNTQTLADFLRDTVKPSWMGYWQSQQWDIAEANATRILEQAMSQQASNNQ